MDKVGVATGRKSGVDDDALGRASRAWRGQPQCLDPFAVLREDDEGRRPRIVNGADDAIAQLGLCATVHLCRREGGGVRGRGRRRLRHRRPRPRPHPAVAQQYDRGRRPDARDDQHSKCRREQPASAAPPRRPLDSYFVRDAMPLIA